MTSFPQELQEPLIFEFLHVQPRNLQMDQMRMLDNKHLILSPLNFLAPLTNILPTNPSFVLCLTLLMDVQLYQMFGDTLCNFLLDKNDYDLMEHCQFDLVQVPSLL